MSIWDRIEEIVDLFDADFEVTVASACCWSGQLRLTLTNPDDAPSRSITFFSAGGGSPEDVLVHILADVDKWMLDEGGTPMPVPDWMKT